MSTDAISALSASSSSSVMSQLAERRLASLSFGGSPKGLSDLPQTEQVKAVSGQFEAILLRQFLQESVSGLMGGENAGPSGNVYGYLLTDVLASKLSEGGGLGLSNILEKQLTPHGRSTPADGAKDPS